MTGTKRSEKAGALERFVADVLGAEGALVDTRPDGLDAILPPALARELDTSEYLRVGFGGPDDTRAADARVSVDYDSPLVERLGRIVAKRGPIGVAPLQSTHLPAAISAEAVLEASVTVQNGIARSVAAERAVDVCVGCSVRFDVRADERTSGLVDVWVAPDARAILPWGPEAWNVVAEGARQEAPVAITEAIGADVSRAATNQAWPIIRARAESIARERLEPFLASLERRRARDLERVGQYYRDIHGEQARKAARLRGETRDREITRLDATIRSYMARVDEVVARYRSTLTLEPVAVILRPVAAWHVRVRLQRRGRVRDVTFLYDPASKRLCPRACDHCQSPTLSAYLCDDHVHYVCRDCYAGCSTCGRPFCRACADRCPRVHAHSPPV